MLTSRFEEIRMKEYKIFDKFNAQLNDIVFNQGERSVENRTMRKVLRYLLEVSSKSHNHRRVRI